MKKSFLFLMIGMVVILTSMSECFNTEITEHSIVSAKINGELFESAETYTYRGGIIHNPYSGPSISLDDQGSLFVFNLSRNMYSEAGDTCSISISVTGETPIELNKKYKIEDWYGSHNNASVDILSYECFYSSEGYLTFTQYEEDNRDGTVSGEFEFVANTYDSDSTVLVTEGTFKKFN